MPSDPLSGLGLDRSDPRLDPRYVRGVRDTADVDDVVLVGVVHDHPASVFRVRSIVEAVDPSVIALELPPLAVPAFRTDADDDRFPPTRGDEMSAAVGAAPDARHVGVDGPSVPFVRILCRLAIAERASLGTLRRVGRSLASISLTTLRCRLAVTVARYTDLDLRSGQPFKHGCTVDDEPAEQATDEARQVDRTASLLRAATPPESVDLRDSAREACMARSIDALRAEGPVVAVVGLDHLDAIHDRLQTTV